MKYTLKKAVKELTKDVKYYNRYVNKIVKGTVTTLKTIADHKYGDADGYTVFYDNGNVITIDGNDMYIMDMADLNAKHIVYIRKHYRTNINSNYDYCDTLIGNYNIKDNYNYHKEVAVKFGIE